MSRGLPSLRRRRPDEGGSHPQPGPDPAGADGHRGEPAAPTTPRACAIAQAPDRERVRLEGHLRTVTLRPRGGAPALEAELHDGTGGVALVWLGRRRIGGITPGRALAVEGRIGRADGVRVIYNPRYELLS
ncbi:hypothetical protein GCM10009737_10300 [Nocardioides lentus]|uniref:DNA-binding protein n=1 Tax=Nocardioides lentus TaxID=338077 RepID=A0ABN2P2Z4_9ACTN